MTPSLNKGFAATPPIGRRDGLHADAAFARAQLSRPAPRSVPRRDGDPLFLDPTVAFLSSSGVHPRVLAQATAEARRLGVTADAALLAGGDLRDDDFYRALARHIGSAFVTQPVSIAPGLDLAAAAKVGVAPLRRWPGGPRWIVAPRGRDIVHGLPNFTPREIVLTTPRRFEAALRASDPDRVAADAASTLDPALSARTGSWPLRWPAVVMTVAVLVLLAWLNSTAVLAIGTVLLGSVFAIACLHRIAACFASLEVRPPAPPLNDRALPTYTVVVALHREANVVDDLVSAMERLDYPRAKLDLKFVVECDDQATCTALAARMRTLAYDIIVAPDGRPRTKPRALNVALPFARGELVTVYDAEDRPDPAQLRLAAAAFARAPADLACLQARLPIDNDAPGALQALFALDYAALFAAFNPGLSALGLPIFLGGSSNHFRREALQRCGGWDAWNVTEDADLGVRLARGKLRVATFDSATAEEAPATLRGFFNQRVRWKKGWLQTFAVHARDPRRLLRDLGARDFIAVMALFVAGLLGPLLWPLFTGALLWMAFAGDLFAPTSFAGQVRSVAICLLAYSGAVAMIVPLALGAVRGGLKRYLFLLPLLPVWHVLLCLAAWSAMFELFRHPYRWSKTDHGQARRREIFDPAAPAQALRAIRPPSTGMVAPVMKDAAGRHSDKVMWATSSGLP